MPLDADGKDPYGWRWGDPDKPLWHCTDGSDSLTVRAPTREKAIEIMTAEGWPPKTVRRFGWDYTVKGDGDPAWTASSTTNATWRPDMPTPDYYLGKSKKLQPVHIIEDFDLSYHRGTALVYIVRAGKKPGEPETKDLKKARAHLDMAIAEAEQREAQKSDDGITCALADGCSAPFTCKGLHKCVNRGLKG